MIDQNEKPAAVLPSPEATAKQSAIIGWTWGGSLLIFGAIAIGMGATRFGSVVASFGFLVLPPVVAGIRKVVPPLRRPLFPALAALIVALGLGVINPLGGPRDNEDGWAAGSSEPSSNGPEIQALWSELTSVTQQCDQAASTASNSLDLSRSDLPQAYAAVESAKGICGRVGLQVMAIDAPRSLDRVKRKAFDDALNQCGLAYAGKSVMFDRMLKVVGGDRRPSRIAAVQEAAQASQAQTVQCVMTMTALAEAQGVVLNEAITGSRQGVER